VKVGLALVTAKTRIDRLGQRLDRHPSATLLAVLSVTVGIRILYLLSLRTSLFFKDPILDSRLYDSWALGVASGQWLGQDAFFMAPLYPYFLGLVYLLFGHDPLAAISIQLLLGSVSCVLAFLIARKVAGTLVAVTAGLMLAFYGPVLFFEGLLLPEFLGILINLTWLYLLVRSGADAGPRTSVVAGVLVGLSALARPSALLFIPCIALWLALARRTSYRRVLTLAGTLVAGACFVLAPVTVRNYAVAHDFVLITSNGGLNFYIGNNPNSDGVYRSVEGLHMVGADPESDWAGRHYAESALGRDLRPSEVSDYWLGESLRFIRQHPGRFVTLVFRKAVLFWNSYEFPQIEDYYMWMDLSTFGVPLLSFAFLGPLGILGMALTIGRGERFALLRLFVVFYMISICIFFVTARYRVHVVSVLSIFSAYSLWWLVDHVSRKSYLRGAYVALASAQGNQAPRRTAYAG